MPPLVAVAATHMAYQPTQNGGTLSGDSLTIVNCTFRDSVAGGRASWMMTGVSASPLGSGGAVFCQIHCAAYNSTFINTHADQSGGAFCTLRGLTLESTTFVNSSAGFFGGAVSVMQVNLSPESLVVSNTTVRGAYATLDGGAFYSESAVFVRDSVFEDTSAGRTGGAICGRSSRNASGPDVIVIGSDFRGASSAEAGGAVFAAGPVTEIVDCDFTNVSSQLVRT